jgi:hypothetical protein
MFPLSNAAVLQRIASLAKPNFWFKNTRVQRCPPQAHLTPSLALQRTQSCRRRLRTSARSRQKSSLLRARRAQAPWRLLPEDGNSTYLGKFASKTANTCLAETHHVADFHGRLLV